MFGEFPAEKLNEFYTAYAERQAMGKFKLGKGNPIEQMTPNYLPKEPVAGGGDLKNPEMAEGVPVRMPRDTVLKKANDRDGHLAMHASPNSPSYGEKTVRIGSNKYDVDVADGKIKLKPAGPDAKAGAKPELPPGSKNRNVSGARMTDAGAKGRIKGAQAALAKAPNPGAKAAAQKNLNAAMVG
jgi:hypothetical protein